MTIVLHDINVTKRRQNNTLGTTGAVNWTLEEYYNMAERCIGTFAEGSMAHAMLQNEDAVAFVAEHLMYGAYRWGEDKGRTVRAYLNQCAIWSIHTWVKRTTIANQIQTLSLHENCSNGLRMHRYQTIADINALPADVIVSRQEQLCSLLDGYGLTSRQKYCLEVVYVQGQKPSDVAKELGISRQALDQCMDKGIQKIRISIDGKQTIFT